MNVLHPFTTLLLKILLLAVCVFGVTFMTSHTVSAAPTQEAKTEHVTKRIANNGASSVSNIATGNKGDAGTVTGAEELKLAGLNKWIYDIFITIGGTFLLLGGSLFDSSITMMVIEMGNIIGPNTGVGHSIDKLWSVIRDVFNMLFIFGLIFIGFQTILSSGSSGAKKALGTLIAAALLINFSLYFTKVIIDFSNVAAHQIYSMIKIDGEYNSSIATIDVEIKSISGVFLKYTDITSYSDSKAKTINEWAKDDLAGTAKILGFALIVMVFMLIAAFVFLAGAILMIVRFIGLIMFLIFSPVMFLGWVYPGLKSATDTWWRMFLSYAFLAPAFLFMLYLSITVLQTMNGKIGGTGGSFSSAFSKSGLESGFFGIFLEYLVIIGFLLASLVVAKKMGVAGASQSINIAHGMRKKAQGVVGGATVGLAARLGRKSFGYLGQKTADNRTLRDASGRGNVFATGARMLGSKVGSSSFDARRVAELGKSLEIGEGKKGGYKADRDAIIKSEKAYADSLGEVGDDDEIVAGYKNSMGISEGKLKTLKGELSSINKETDRDAWNTKSDDIAAVQKEFDAQKAKYKGEKYRRQLGSVSENATLAERKGDVIAGEKVIDELRVKLTNTKETYGGHSEEASTAKQELMDQIKKVSGLKKKARKGGRAGILENRFATSLFFGRFANQDNMAGEEIRSGYEKKAKQSKEDANAARIINTLEANSKKGD